MLGDINTLLPNETTFVLPSPPSTRSSFLILSRTTSATLSPKSPGLPIAQSSVIAKPKRKLNLKHPPLPNMIDEAIFEKSPRGKGLSLIRIKKYLNEKYCLNIKYSARRIREYINKSLQSGRFIQQTGRGANGSFRLSSNVRRSFNQIKNKVNNDAIKIKVNIKKKSTAPKSQKNKAERSYESSNVLKSRDMSEINVPTAPKSQKRTSGRNDWCPTDPKKRKNYNEITSKVAKMGAM